MRVASFNSLRREISGRIIFKVRSYTEELCSSLEIEDYIPQPSVDVSPAKWNIAHTTWFFEEMILKKFAAYKVFDPNSGFFSIAITIRSAKELPVTIAAT